MNHLIYNNEILPLLVHAKSAIRDARMRRGWGGTCWGDGDDAETETDRMDGRSDRKPVPRRPRRNGPPGFPFMLLLLLLLRMINSMRRLRWWWKLALRTFPEIGRRRACILLEAFWPV